MQEVLKKYDILLIADEVSRLTGPARRVCTLPTSNQGGSCVVRFSVCAFAWTVVAPLLFLVLLPSKAQERGSCFARPKFEEP